MYELPQELVFRCYPEEVKNYVVKLVFYQRLHGEMLAVHQEKFKMKTLMDNMYIHTLRFLLGLAGDSEYLQSIEPLTLRIQVVLVPKKHRHKTTHVVIKLKNRVFGILKTLCMTVVEMRSLQSYDIGDSILYVLPQQLVYHYDESIVEKGLLKFTFYDSLNIESALLNYLRDYFFIEEKGIR